MAAAFFGLPPYIFLLWNAPFVGFICPDGGFLDVEIGIMFFVVLVIVPIFCGAGYIVGINKILRKNKTRNN